MATAEEATTKGRARVRMNEMNAGERPLEPSIQG